MVIQEHHSVHGGRSKVVRDYVPNFLIPVLIVILHGSAKQLAYIMCIKLGPDHFVLA